MAMSKAELKNAFREAASYEFREIPQDDSQIQHDFSAAFEERMEKIIKKDRSFFWKFVNTASKRAAVAAVVCMALILTACSVPAIREPIVRFIVEVFDIDMRYSYDNNAPDVIETKYHLSVIPNGFSETNAYTEDGYSRIDYEDEKGNLFYVLQNTETTFLSIDTENTEHKILDIDGREVNLHISEYDTVPDRVITAVWIEDGYFFKVCAVGIFDEQTVVEIVSNIKPIE